MNLDRRNIVKTAALLPLAPTLGAITARSTFALLQTGQVTKPRFA